MNRHHLITIMGLLACMALGSCAGEYNTVLKCNDYDYQYEAAKSYFGAGHNTKAATILESILSVLKGTTHAEESTYLLALAYLNMEDYVSASHYFTMCYNTYPHGDFTEQARYMSGRSLFLDTPDPRLDQGSTHKALNELQTYMEYYSDSPRANEVQEMMFTLQERLVEKEYIAAKLYFDLGPYTGNASYTTDQKINGNNFLACITTVQNVLKDYPYTKRREELCILMLRAKYRLGEESVLEKKEERMRDAVDEYYSFKNEFPDSKYMKECERIYANASKFVSESKD